MDYHIPHTANQHHVDSFSFQRQSLRVSILIKMITLNHPTDYCKTKLAFLECRERSTCIETPGMCGKYSDSRVLPPAY